MTVPARVGGTGETDLELEASCEFRCARSQPAWPPAEPAAAPGIPAVPALDPWMVLGIHKGAHLDMARKAYRALVIQYHPDKVASLAPEFRKIAEERTREINLAWAMLEKELGG